MATRRLVIGAIAAIGVLSAFACADDFSGGDCVTEGFAQMGRAQADSGAVTCELPAESWIVALPANADPGPTSGLPQQYWVMVRESAKSGHTWCVSGEAAGKPGGMLCRQLPFRVPQLLVVRARTVVVEIGRAPDGAGILQGLRAARP